MVCVDYAPDAGLFGVKRRRCCIERVCNPFFRGFLAIGLLFSQQVAHAAFGGYLPLQVTGSVSYGYGYFESAGTESETTTLLGNLNASGYVWQPWFATTSAAIGLGFTNTETSTSSSDGTVASGVFTLDVFPRSRFPFSLTYSVTDSQTESFNEAGQTPVGVESRSTRLSLRQAYRGRRGANYTGWYSLTNFEAESVDSESVTYGLNMQGHRSSHQYSASLNHSDSQTNISDAEPSTEVFSASHIYTPSTDFGVTSIVTYVEADSGLDFSEGGRQTNIAQGTSSFYWRPEHRSFNVRGGVRLSEVNNDSSDASSTQRSLSTNLGGSYSFSRSLRMGASATVSSSEGEGMQTLSSSQTVNLGYASPSHQILGFSYSWQTGVNGSNSSVRTDNKSGEVSSTNAQNVGASFGHNASNSWRLGGAGSLGFSMGQSFSGGKSSEHDQVSKGINHSAGLSASVRSFLGSTYGSLRVTDSRTESERETKFRQLSANLSQDMGLSPLSSLSVNAAYQASKSQQEDDMGQMEGRLERTVNGTARYSHSRPFGIYNMRFFSRFVASKQIDSPEPSYVRDWDSRFTYSLGLLDTMLSFRIIESAGGNRSKTLFFRATRSF